MYRTRPHWSYSALSQYLRCPLQYFFQRVLGMPIRSIGAGLALGSAVHAGLAEYHRRLKAGMPVSSEDVINAFRDQWDEKEASEEIQFAAGETPERVVEQGVHLLELYLEEPPPEQVVAVEQVFVAPLYNSRGEFLETPLVAITDLITVEGDQLKVTEFKTSGRAYSEGEASSSLQPTCYVHAVRECLGQDANVEYTVLIKTKTPKVQRLQTSRYADDCGRLGDLVEKVQRGVDLGIYYPVESPMNCANCSFRQPCREWGASSRQPETISLSSVLAEADAC